MEVLELTKAVVAQRDKWEYRGQKRPRFAVEPGPEQESVWDYPRPPRIEEEGREVLVRTADILIVLSKNAIRSLETAGAPTIYVPPEDVELAQVGLNRNEYFCEWKGIAQGVVGCNGNEIGWQYVDTFGEYESIKGWYSFYPGRVYCYLGKEMVRAQAGGYYGGWISPEVVGPFKGDPGTEGL